MTLEAAAEAGDLNPVHVWKIEKAQLNVTVATLVRLATAYGVEVEELFGAKPAAAATQRRQPAPRSKRAPQGHAPARSRKG